MHFSERMAQLTVIIRHRSPSPSSDRRIILTSVPQISIVVKGRMIWRPPSSPRTRLLSRTHQAARSHPNSTRPRPLRQHQKQQGLRGEEEESHEQAEVVVYLHAVVPQEVQEGAVASQEVVLGGDEAHNEIGEAEQPRANDTLRAAWIADICRYYKMMVDSIYLGPTTSLCTRFLV